MARDLYIYRCTKDSVSVEALKDVVVKRDGKIIRRVVNNTYMLARGQGHSYYNKDELDKYIEFTDSITGYVTSTRYITFTKGMVDIVKLKYPIIQGLIKQSNEIEESIKTLEGLDITEKD